MELVTVGDVIRGDVCVYPDERTVKVAHDVFLPY